MRAERIIARLLLTLLAVAIVGWLSETAVGTFLPAIALFVLLWRGRYVGERQVQRLAAGARRRSRSRRPLKSAVPAAHRRALVRRPHGGLLLAFSVAVRPPPAPAMAA